MSVNDSIVTIQNNIQGVVNNMETNIQGAVNKMEDHIQGAVNKMEDHIQGAVNKMEHNIQGAVNKMENNINNDLNKQKIEKTFTIENVHQANVNKFDLVHLVSHNEFVSKLNPDRFEKNIIKVKGYYKQIIQSDSDNEKYYLIFEEYYTIILKDTPANLQDGVTVDSAFFAASTTTSDDGHRIVNPETARGFQENIVTITPVSGGEIIKGYKFADTDTGDIIIKGGETSFESVYRDTNGDQVVKYISTGGNSRTVKAYFQIF